MVRDIRNPGILLFAKLLQPLALVMKVLGRYHPCVYQVILSFYSAILAVTRRYLVERNVGIRGRIVTALLSWL
jgi:hypothetical protein